MIHSNPETVIILHPTEELIFSKLQKELISDFFDQERILYAVKALWIQIESSANPCIEKITSVEFSDLDTRPTEIFIPVTIKADGTTLKSHLSLVKIHCGKAFTDSEYKAITQKKQPVKQIKVFRLGSTKKLNSRAQCLTDSKWLKLK